MDRSPAVTLLVVHALVLALCGLTAGLMTVGWGAFAVMALLDPTSPAGLGWFFGIGLIVRLFSLLATAFATVTALAAAASLHRGEPRFVVLASIAALLVPGLNLVLGLFTFDVLACLWSAPMLVGCLAGVVALAATVGTRPGRGSGWSR